MTAFLDAAQLQYATPAGLHDLLAPAADADNARVRALVATVHDLPPAGPGEILKIEITDVVAQRPLFAPVEHRGSWLQSLPGHTRGDVTVHAGSGTPSSWVDIAARLAVTLTVPADPPGIDVVAAVDLAGGGALAQVRGAPATPGTAVQRRLVIDLAVLIREAVDLVAAMRDVRLVQAAAGRPRAVGDDERVPCAPLVVFPPDALPQGGPTAAQIQEYFTAQRVVVVFDRPDAAG